MNDNCLLISTAIDEMIKISKIYLEDDKKIEIVVLFNKYMWIFKMFFK